MTLLAGMNEELDNKNVKKELMRCFSDAPTTIQAIEKLRGMKQIPGENARLYAARYKVIHFRANQLMAEEQNQSGEMMFYSWNATRSPEEETTQEDTFYLQTPKESVGSL